MIDGYAASLYSNLRSDLHTCRALCYVGLLVTCCLTRTNICPRYLNAYTPSMRSASSSPVRLNVVFEHLDAIAAYLLQHIISVFLAHRANPRCLMSRPAFILIPHKSQWVSGSNPSSTTATLDWKWRYIKCLQITSHDVHY